jgi:Family of unknown function (DUF6191)
MSFSEIFQPGLRHLREERERQRLMVARPPAAGPAPLGIDLDAGTAVLPAPTGRSPSDAPLEPGEHDPARPEGGPRLPDQGSASDADPRTTAGTGTRTTAGTGPRTTAGTGTRTTAGTGTRTTAEPDRRATPNLS